jgi:hypothetical protein
LAHLRPFGLYFWALAVAFIQMVSVSFPHWWGIELGRYSSSAMALLSIAGCAQYVGKGKAPPLVVTKG